MKIAIAYDNGTIFQHFGRTETFKIYEANEEKILSSELIKTGECGHSALAGFLAENGIGVLICGGIGDGAQRALAEAGIEICSGVSGDCDEAAEAYLRGELFSAGVTCSHHEEEEESGCGCGGSCGDDESGCQGGCGGCGGGCHGKPQPIMEGKNVMKTVRVHYKGTLNDGSQFDSSYDRGEPLEYLCGVGMMIYGFDAAVANMEPGDITDVHLSPEEAYGMPDPNAIFTVEIAQLPGSEELTAGQRVFLQNTMGQPFPVVVSAKTETTITFDANHEMAGKELNFKIELLSVTE